MSKVVSFLTLLVLAVGCGSPVLFPSDIDAEKAQSALTGVVTQTISGHNKAQTSSKYTCNGWTYRMLFSLEQHRDPASPTGWYAAVGPSSVAATGSELTGISADTYLECYWGILVADHGTLPGGQTWSGDLIATSLGIPCSMTTVWPASWHLPNPVISVTLDSYHYVPSVNFLEPDGTIYLSLSSSYPTNVGGSGWCGGGWKGGAMLTVDKLPLPPPATIPPLCSQSNEAGCVVDPPCGGLDIGATKICLAGQPPPV